MKRGLLIAFALALVAAAPARAGGPSMVLGVTDDQVRSRSYVETKATMALAQAVGFGAVRVSALWTPPLTQPIDPEMGVLYNVARAGRLTGMRVFLAVYNPGSKTTPLTDEDRSQFATYAATIAQRIPYVRDITIGNEPNLNGSWLPQFNPDGSDAAAPAYFQLLAQTYDSLKAVSPKIRVIGGALAPRGADNPDPNVRQTHSPTQFIRDLGAAYRESGRTVPIMDAFDMHPYQDNSTQAPSTKHGGSKTITIADYGKLVRLLGEAFDGTAQRGSTLPIYYEEYGVETLVPAAKARLYEGTEPATTRPVPEATQAAYYRQALQLAFCQPNVQGFFLFHLFDETNLNRWQSGLYYADKTPKTILPAMRAVLAQSRRGIIARCPGLQLKVRGSAAFGPRSQLGRRSPITFKLRCDIDCRYEARVQRFQGRASPLVVHGRAVGGVVTRVRFPARRLSSGRYRIAVTLLAAVNTGPSKTVASAPFRVGKGRTVR